MMALCRYLLLVMCMALVACGEDVESEAQVKQAQPKGSLVIEEAYIKQPAPGQKMGAVYLRITNSGDEERQLFAIDSDVAGFAEVHRSFYEDGMRRMRHVKHLVVSPGQTLTFEPGSYHIMLMDMVQLPEIGKTFPMTLEFNAGEIHTVSVEVRAVH